MRRVDRVVAVERARDRKTERECVCVCVRERERERERERDGETEREGELRQRETYRHCCLMDRRLMCCTEIHLCTRQVPIAGLTPPHRTQSVKHTVREHQ